MTKHSMLIVVSALLATAPAQSLTVDGSAREVGISVVRRIELDYYLLTPGSPIEFAADGPTWLRVYTRLWWPRDASGDQQYRLSLWQDDVERPLEFETRLSSSSYATDGHPVGRWRSFYIQVPGGENRYRLETPEATVAVRFKFQRPRPWQPVPVDGATPVTLANGSDTATFYRATTGAPVHVDVEGPGTFRARLRLDYAPAMVGAQNYQLTVTEQDEELASRNFRVSRSSSAQYVEEPGLVPSTEKSVSVKLDAGRHRLALTVTGTLAASYGVAAERRASEKYE